MLLVSAGRSASIFQCDSRQCILILVIDVIKVERDEADDERDLEEKKEGEEEVEKTLKLKGAMMKQMRDGQRRIQRKFTRLSLFMGKWVLQLAFANSC